MKKLSSKKFTVVENWKNYHGTTTVRLIGRLFARNFSQRRLDMIRDISKLMALKSCKAVPVMKKHSPISSKRMRMLERCGKSLVAPPIWVSKFFQV